MSLQDQLRRFMAPLTSRVRLMVARGVIKLVDDAKKMQALQVSVQADVVRDKVERFQEYGFTSVPMADAEAILLAIGGNTAHMVCVAVDDRRYRPKTGLQPGDVALYRLDEGVLVKLLAGQNVELGPSPTDYVALAIPTKAELQAIVTNINTNITAIQTTLTQVAALLNAAGPVVGAPGAVTPYVKTAASNPGDVKATKVKAI